MSGIDEKWRMRESYRRDNPLSRVNSAMVQNGGLAWAIIAIEVKTLDISILVGAS